MCTHVCGISVSSCLLRFNALWLFWRSEMTLWERGQSSLPPLLLLLFPSFHLSISPSFLSCILISLLCGSWYVDFIKFSSGWVTEKTGGDQGSHPLFSAFICLFSFIPTRGLRLLGACGEKVSQEPLPSLGHCVSWQLPDSIWRSESRKRLKSSNLPSSLTPFKN